MPDSQIWRDKLVLAVDDEEDVLRTIQDELSNCPGVLVHVAQTFVEASGHLVSFTYDLVVIGTVGARGRDILNFAVDHNFPVVLLANQALDPYPMVKYVQPGARGYLPKDQLNLLVPLLEEVMGLSSQSMWQKVIDQVGTLFSRSRRPTALRTARGVSGEPRTGGPMRGGGPFFT